MGRETFRILGLGAMVAALAVPASSGAGVRDVLRGTGTHGKAEVYGVSPHGDRDSSKYEEYRDIPRDHPFVDELELHHENEEKSYYIEFRTEDTLQDDQRYILRMGKYGKYEMELGWDEIPHRLSNAARTLYREEPSGVFTLPDETQQQLQGDAALAEQIFSLARGTRLSLGRDTGRFSFHYTPMPSWDVRLGYRIDSTDGRRPIGTGFAFGRAQPIELPSPIDYRTHDIDGSIQYVQELWSMRLSYSGSIFENGVDTLVWDNPYQAADSAFQSSRGRLDLAPENQAHTIGLDAVAHLPMRSQLVGAISYGWMTQDDDFLPFTINRALAQPSLTESSLDGELNPLVANVRLYSRPSPKLGFNAGYRLYDLGNDSRMIDFPGYVETDSAVVDVARRNLPYEYTVHRGTVGTDYRLTSWSKVAIDYEWENWHRRFREVRDSDEHRIGPSIDLTPRRWLTLRTSYTRSWRDASGYDTRAAEVGFPEGEEGNERLPQLRKFDEAARNRDEVAFLATFTPRSTLSFVASFRLANDDYTRSEYGMLRNQYLSPGLDVAYGLTRDLILFANYTFELYDYRQRSRERPVEGGEIVDDPANDWTTHGQDSVHTVGVGLDYTVIPKKLTFNLDYSISQAHSRTDTFGRHPDAADYPAVRSRYQQLDAIFRYDLAKGVFVRTGYRYERYDETDFATTALASGNLEPFAPDTGRTMFLGAVVPDYMAHIAVAGVGFEW